MADANEQFIIASMSRADIAELCNDVCDMKFTPSDDRLTGEFCQHLVDEWADIFDADLCEEDRGAEQRAMVKQLVEERIK